MKRLTIEQWGTSTGAVARCKTWREAMDIASACFVMPYQRIRVYWHKGAEEWAVSRTNDYDKRRTLGMNQAYEREKWATLNRVGIYSLENRP